ncbi:MAG: hypothetical protein ABFQ95_00040 [Pseudomonadota bacterium]
MIEVFGIPQTSILKNCIPSLTLTFATIFDIAFSPPLVGIGLHSEHMVLYTWLIFYPSLVPLSVLVAVGLLQDCTAGLTLGASVILLMGFYSLTIYNRHHFNQHSFWILWLGFAGIEISVQLLAWLLAFIKFPDSSGEIMFVQQTLITVACYPLIGWMILKIHSKLHISS